MQFFSGEIIETVSRGIPSHQSQKRMAKCTRYFSLLVLLLFNFCIVGHYKSDRMLLFDVSNFVFVIVNVYC